MSTRNSEASLAAALIADDGTRLELSGEHFIGRAPENDYVIPAPRVSGRHALLRYALGVLKVMDLDSSNGTTINGRMVEKETEVYNGDILCLANVCYLVALPSSDLDDSEDAQDLTVVHSVLSKPAEKVEDDNATRVLIAADLSSSESDNGVVSGTNDVFFPAGFGDTEERSSKLPHLVVLAESAKATQIFELAIEEGDEPCAWEIGRSPNCQIVLYDSSVSEQHAQLRYERGEWRLVNLLAANGVFVNNNKQLAVKLCDGDSIRLGDVQLLFREQSLGEDGRPIQPLSKSDSRRTQLEALRNAGKGLSMPLRIAVFVALATVIATVVALVSAQVIK